MVVGELGALLTTEMLPVTLPAAAGANLALRVVLWPTAKVTGRVSPLTLKTAPVTLAWEMVRLALPKLVKVTICELLLPTVTFPKLMLVGFAPSWLLPVFWGDVLPATPTHPVINKAASTKTTSAKPLRWETLFMANIPCGMIWVDRKA